MRFLVASVLAGLLFNFVPAMAKDQPAIPLPKTSKWEMNYDPDFCQLLATFGSGKDIAIVELRREHPGDGFDWQFYSQLIKFSETQMPIELTFGPGGKPIKRTGIVLTMSGPKKLPVVRVTGLRIDGWEGRMYPELVPAVTAAQEAKITEIEIKLPFGKRYRLVTGSMAAPLSAMRTCTTDLIKTWGYDPAVEDTLTKRAQPVGSPAKWIGSADYPSASWTQGHNGLVRFRIDVDSTGQPKGCRVLYRTSPDEFADLSCKLLMQRARFTPALDVTGKPVKSYYINSIRWMTEREG